MQEEQSGGITDSERVLARLARGTFLKLWSYPNLFRDQGQVATGGDGKELSDLCVLFGDHVLLFSDKRCVFPDCADIDVAWRRWKRRAIDDSVKQVLGAKRWITKYPDRVFTDRRCTKKLPIQVPSVSSSNYHLIVVASGATEACAEFYDGGSGSLMLNYGTNVPRSDLPFSIGDVNAGGDFIHVFDEITIQVVMNELDTIQDFVEYLARKESFLRSGKRVAVAGEEDLLALYVRERASDKADLLGFPDGYDMYCLDAGAWDDLCVDPQFLARKQVDKVSYLWDRIIDEFAKHALEGTLIPGSESISGMEQALRFMASFPRFARRVCSESLMEVVTNAPDAMCFRRTLMRVPEDDVAVVLCAYPWDGEDHDSYREARRADLGCYCIVVGHERRHSVRRVLGIATESGVDNDGRSHDLMLFEPKEWTKELCAKAVEMQKEFGYHRSENLRWMYGTNTEYPDEKTGSFVIEKSVGRNSPCPCGSGRKFKRCCGGPKSPRARQYGA